MSSQAPLPPSPLSIPTSPESDVNTTLTHVDSTATTPSSPENTNIETGSNNEMNTCGKCSKEIEDAHVCYTFICEHVYHPWCFLSFVGELNNCMICKIPGRTIFNKYVDKGSYTSTPPTTFAAPYIVMDILMRSLGDRPPYSHERYHRYREIMGLEFFGAAPPQLAHSELVHGTDQEGMIKKLYSNLHAEYTQVVDEEKLAGLGFQGYGFTDHNISIINKMAGKKFNLTGMKCMPFEVFLENHGINIMSLVPGKTKDVSTLD